MAHGGIAGILVTAPLASPDALDRLRRLLLRGADIRVVADDPRLVVPLAAVARASGQTLPVIVELDVGVGRTGCVEIADVVALARAIDAAPALRFAGLQAYWGNLQQVAPFEERVARIAPPGEAGPRRPSRRSAMAGLPPEIVTGGGTGSHRIDAATGLFTEMQPGSFLFLDSCYGAIAISETEQPVPAGAVCRGERGLGDPPRTRHRQCRLEGLRHG